LGKPRVDTVSGGATFGSKESSAMKRPLILIASNDPQIETIARAVARETGRNCAQARALPETWRLYTAEGRRIAFVLFDLDIDQHSMPFLRLLARSKPHFPILAVTSNADEVFDASAMEGVVFEHLLKPVSEEKLRETVLRLCRDAEMRGGDALLRW